MLDSSASHHMCPNKDLLTTYKKVDGGNVIMANNVICKTIGIGTIHIRMHDSVVRTLTNVRHVAELQKNLISLMTLDDKGYKYSDGCGVIRVTKGALVVMKGVKEGPLYILQGSIVTIFIAIVSPSEQLESDQTKLWHMRLTHSSEKGMSVLSKQGLLEGHKVAKL